MSRDFWGKDGKPSPVDREPEKTYRKGMTFSQERLVKEIVDIFEQKDANELTSRLDDDLKKRIHAEEDIDGAQFLDAVVRGLERGDVSDQMQLVSSGLTKVMQILYEGGENSFVLDLTRFPLSRTMYREPGVPIPRKLRATKDLPISIQCFLPDAQMDYHFAPGHQCRYVRMSVSGKARQIGSFAKQSTFYVKGLPQMMGNYADDCSFYLSDAEAVLVLPKLDGHIFSDRVTITVVGMEGEMELPRKFTERNNHLYIPDGDGGWHEVDLS